MSILSRKPIHREGSHLNVRTTTETRHSSHEHLSVGGTSYEADDSLLSNSTAYEDSDEAESSSIPTSISRRSTSKRNEFYNRTGSPVRARSNPRNESRNISSKEPANRRKSFPYFWAVVCSGILILSVLVWPRVKTTTQLRECAYQALKAGYPNENKYLWKSLRSGIEDILNNRSDKPAVFLFVHSGGKAAKNLIKDIANTSSSCFDSSMKLVEVQSIEFTSEHATADHGYIIAKYKKIVKEENVILIADLNEVPPEAARALHAICDTETPLVRKVVIFLSLVAEHKGGKVIDTATDALQELWESKLKSNELGPLITRVTDEVILLETK